jgi:hypothetical protein
MITFIRAAGFCLLSTPGLGQRPEYAGADLALLAMPFGCSVFVC